MLQTEQKIIPFMGIQKQNKVNNEPKVESPQESFELSAYLHLTNLISLRKDLHIYKFLFAQLQQPDLTITKL